MPEPIARLVLVYNADSGPLALLMDAAKKLLRAGDCTLCDLTHGMTGERADWQSCKRDLGIPIDALHRDELDDELRALLAGALPSVVAEGPAGRQVLLGPKAIASCNGSVDSLRKALRERAAELGLGL